MVPSPTSSSGTLGQIPRNSQGVGSHAVSPLDALKKQVLMISRPEEWNNDSSMSSGADKRDGSSAK